MRALIQRVSQASVSVEGETIGAIGQGLLILICDEAGKMNRSLLDIGGSALVVSQFTLAADTSRGNRPGFSAAAAPDEGRALYEAFASDLAALGIPVETGSFGADMQVSLTNSGPVTIWMDDRS